MKKGLRKKLHRGKFQEFGFAIAWRFAHALDSAATEPVFRRAR